MRSRLKRSQSRLGLIQQFLKETDTSKGPSLNIGCKETSLGDIRLDISGHPDVKGSALYLPFKPNVFSVAVFTEVLEHLPRGTEQRAFHEISRVLKQDGVLIFSTPTSQGAWGMLYWLMDPTFWVIDHRHYRVDMLKQLLKSNSLSIELSTRRGGPRDMLFSLVTPALYVIRKLGYSLTPNFGSDYSSEAPQKGYTFIALARKL